MKKRTFKLRSCSGESLIESLVSILIVTFASLMLVMAVIVAGRLNASAATVNAQFQKDLSTAEAQTAENETTGKTITVTDSGGLRTEVPVTFYRCGEFTSYRLGG